MSKKKTPKAQPNPLDYFLFGFSVADHINDARGPRFRKMIEVLLEIANGDLTLMHTPEETIANLESLYPELATHVAPNLRALLRRGRMQNQRYAEKILRLLRGPNKK